MTLLVGILAKDGVVVAADRAVTFGFGKSFTVSDKAKKIAVIDSKVIVASTGEVGLGQRFRDQVEKAWASKKCGVPGVDLGRQLSNATVVDFQNTGAGLGDLGALLACGNSHGFHLIEFASRNFQPEIKGAELPYVSMGSGQSLADPYLALIRRSVWTDTTPTLADATFAAYWVMHQAIAAAPGFIGEPIDVAVLRRRGNGEYAASVLTEAEILEHQSRVRSANTQLAAALRGEASDGTPSVPPIPVQ